MQTSLQPGSLYLDSRPVWAENEASTFFADEQISTIEKELVDGTRHLPFNQKIAAEVAIRKQIHSVRDQIGRMRLLQCESAQIRSELTRLITEVRVSTAALYHHNSFYDAQKQAGDARALEITGGLQSAAIHLPQFTRKPRISALPTPTPASVNESIDAFAQGPREQRSARPGVFESAAKFSLVEQLNDVEMVAGALRLTGNGLVATAKMVCSITPETNELCKQIPKAGAVVVKTVVESVRDVSKMALKETKKVCNTTPEIRKGCKTTLDLTVSGAKAIERTLGLKELMKKANEFRHFLQGSEVVNVLSKELEFMGIPKEPAREMAKQYISDLPIVFGSVVPCGMMPSLPKRIVPKILKQFLENELGGIALPSIRQKKGHVLSKSADGSKEAIIAEIYRLAKKDKAHYMASSVERYSEVASQMIPSYSHLSNAQTAEKLWAQAIGEFYQIDFVPTDIKYYSILKKKVVRLCRGNESFIVKESGHVTNIVDELIGLHFLRSLQLRYTQLPDPITAIQYGRGQFRRYAIIKTFQEGNVYSSIIKDIGSKVAHSVERNDLLKAFEESVFNGGKGVGEFHSKGASWQHLGDIRRESMYATYSLDNIVLETQSELKRLNLTLPKNFYQYRSKIHDLIKKPGNLSHGFGDIHGGQFTASLESRSFGYIDAETVPLYFDVLKHPRTLAAREYSAFLNHFELEGILHKLSSEERGRLMNAFKTGYLSEYKGAFSPAAERFFTIYESLNHIKLIAQSISAGKNIDRNILTDLIKNFQNQL